MHLVGWFIWITFLYSFFHLFVLHALPVALPLITSITLAVQHTLQLFWHWSWTSVRCSVLGSSVLYRAVSQYPLNLRGSHSGITPRRLLNNYRCDEGLQCLVWACSFLFLRWLTHIMKARWSSWNVCCFTSRHALIYQFQCFPKFWRSWRTTQFKFENLYGSQGSKTTRKFIWVQSQVSPCGICGIRSGTATGFPPNLQFSPCIIPPMLHTHLFIHLQCFISLATDSVVLRDTL